MSDDTDSVMVPVCQEEYDKLAAEQREREHCEQSVAAELYEDDDGGRYYRHCDLVALLKRERAAARAPVEAELRDLKLRVDLDALGNRERDAVELVELRAKYAALRDAVRRVVHDLRPDYGRQQGGCTCNYCVMLQLLETP